MSYNKTERENYNDHRNNACDRLGITKNQYNSLRRFANELSQIDEESCNGAIDENLYEICESSAMERLSEYLIKINRAFFYTYHQTDPRGASLYISNDEELANANYTNGIAIF